MQVQEFLAEEKRLEQKRRQVIDALLAERKRIDGELMSVGYAQELVKKRGRPKKEDKKDAAN